MVFRFAAFGSLLLGAAACDHRQASVEEPASFFDLVRDGYEVRYSSVSGVSEMTDLSELVVIGRMRAVEAGGTALGNRTVVVELHVEQTLKGSDNDAKVYVEIITGPHTTVDKLKRVLPSGASLWFLQDAVASVSSTLDEGRGEGLPSGETLYTAASPQGLLMESDAGLVQPLEPDRELWLPDVKQYASLLQVAEAIERTGSDASF